MPIPLSNPVNPMNPLNPANPASPLSPMNPAHPAHPIHRTSRTHQTTTTQPATQIPSEVSAVILVAAGIILIGVMVLMLREINR